MHTERLLRLADFLMLLTPTEFNLKTWVTAIPYGLRAHFGECGTVACAGGWACSIEEFKQAGLKIKQAPALVPSFAAWNDVKKAFVTYYGCEALEKFFGLTTNQVFDLFYMGGYGEENYLFDSYQQSQVKPETVATKIRALVKNTLKTRKQDAR